MSIAAIPLEEHERDIPRSIANQHMTPGRYYGNASTTTRYVSEISKVPARGEGAMAAYRLPSLGV